MKITLDLNDKQIKGLKKVFAYQKGKEEDFINEVFSNFVNNAVKASKDIETHNPVKREKLKHEIDEEKKVIQDVEKQEKRIKEKEKMRKEEEKKRKEQEKIETKQKEQKREGMRHLKRETV